MAYFEHAGNNGFVVMELTESTVVLRWGRIGHAPVAEREVQLDDDDAAQKWFAGRVHALARRGYHPGRRNQDFVDAIVAAPNDDGIRQVYGDWLQVEGDPRGELIAIQAARTAHPNDSALLSREQAAIKAHMDTVGSNWAKRSTIDWHLGFARSVTYFQDTDRIDIAHAYTDIRELLRHPTCRFLERLRVTLEQPDDIADTPWRARSWQSLEENLGELVRDSLRQPSLLTEVIFESPMPMRPGFLAVDLALFPFAFVVQPPKP